MASLTSNFFPLFCVRAETILNHPFLFSAVHLPQECIPWKFMNSFSIIRLHPPLLPQLCRTWCNLLDEIFAKITIINNHFRVNIERRITFVRGESSVDVGYCEPNTYERSYTVWTEYTSWWRNCMIEKRIWWPFKLKDRWKLIEIGPMVEFCHHQNKLLFLLSKIFEENYSSQITPKNKNEIYIFTKSWKSVN